MRLGVVTTSYPRHAGDPAGGFVADQVAALRALGHDVDVIAAGPGGPGDLATARVPSALFARGGAPDSLERGPLRALPEAALVTARLLATVARRARGWDAILAHWLAPSALAALPTRVPLVAIAHGGDIFTLRRLHLLRPALAALHRRGARLVFVAEHLRQIALAAAPALRPWLAGALVQPMGLPLARFAALARVPEGFVLIIARLVPIKGVDVALAALPLTTSRPPLIIAGDGPERARLAAPTGVRFLGAVTPEARDDLLRRAAAVVIPSRTLASGRTEGTPLVALEALAAGVPVIASAVGGLADLPGVALVQPDDPAALARAIDTILGAPPAEHLLRAGVAALDSRAVAGRLLTLLRA